MTINPAAFDRYRRSPTEKMSLPRMAIGVVIVIVCWFGTTLAVIFGGSYAWMSGEQDPIGFGDPVQQFLGTSGGLFATLTSFAGIWLGLWIAMRFLHMEKLSRLFGNSARISRSSLCKGFAAVLVTSLFSEIAYLVVLPGISRGSVEIGTWLLLVVPVAVFAFVQTSSEELLFRGYLQRGLASRFRSPIVWAVLPTLAFTALHLNPASVPAMNVAVLVAIGAFAALLALLVYATGNLGAAMGAHLGNNLVGFVLISHDETLGGLALFRAAPLDNLAWTPGETATIAGISVVSILLTWLLLMYPRSPLRVGQDDGRAPGSLPPSRLEPESDTSQP